MIRSIKYIIRVNISSWNENEIILIILMQTNDKRRFISSHLCQVFTYTSNCHYVCLFKYNIILNTFLHQPCKHFIIFFFKIFIFFSVFSYLSSGFYYPSSCCSDSIDVRCFCDNPNQTHTRMKICYVHEEEW